MLAYVIRHGQSENNAKPESERVCDPGLTEKGIQQAEHLATWAKMAKLDRIIASPFRRAVMTAQPSILATECPAEVWPEIHEVGGCYSGHLASKIVGEKGMNREQLLAMHPSFHIDDRIQEHGWWPHAHRETDDEARIRVGSFIERLIENFSNSTETIAFVAHADFKSMLAFELDGGKTRRYFEAPYNASIMVMKVDDGQVELVDYNLVEHLPEDLLTI